jgi:hypothetical protein
VENIPRQHATPDESTQWKTQEYHGRQIHVCTALRTVDNEELAGHGQQWKFTVRVTGNGGGTPEDECARADSDPEIFYSSQSIAEDLGFVRGRELIEGL